MSAPAENVEPAPLIMAQRISSVTRDRLQSREKLLAHRALEPVHHFETIEDHLRNCT